MKSEKRYERNCLKFSLIINYLKMIRNILALFSVLLLASCWDPAENNENNSNTWIIKDTVNTIDWYWETLKGSIEWARDVTNMINDRYDTIESKIPK